MGELRCPTCKSLNVTDDHAVRCAWETHQRGRVEAAAEHYAVPTAKAVDLWAHLRETYGDVERAADRAIRVIELGWRPLVKEQP